jgi:hypothetical protein
VGHEGKYAIIGAGPAGLTAAKNLLQCGIACEVFEREDDVGGNWYYGKAGSAVYQSTHLISSARLTGFTDFPMPPKPDYPRHDQVLLYLRDYARHFGLYEHVHFNTSVEHCEREPDGTWQVTLSNGERQCFAGLLICNGHLSEPNLPDYPGTFAGEILHTKHYKTPDVLRGRRVLVVGAGNSGCDLAVEAVYHAAAVFHSTRRGYHYIPKYIFGIPTDQVNERTNLPGTPRWLRRSINTLVIRLVLGNPARFGLPAPDHRLLDSHPIVNSQMLYHVGHGDIIPKPDVKELRGGKIVFRDGSAEQIDLIVYATGYRMSFPFIDPAHLNWQDKGPGLFMHFLHPTYDNLFVIGLLQPDSGIFWMMDEQAQVVARFIHAQTHNLPAADALRRLKAGPQPDIRGGRHHIDSPRHFLEVDHYAYRQAIRRLLKLLPEPTPHSPARR